MTPQIEIPTLSVGDVTRAGAQSRGRDSTGGCWCDGWSGISAWAMCWRGRCLVRWACIF